MVIISTNPRDVTQLRHSMAPQPRDTGRGRVSPPLPPEGTRGRYPAAPSVWLPRTEVPLIPLLTGRDCITVGPRRGVSCARGIAVESSPERIAAESSPERIAAESSPVQSNAGTSRYRLLFGEQCTYQVYLPIFMIFVLHYRSKAWCGLAPFQMKSLKAIKSENARMNISKIF